MPSRLVADFSDIQPGNPSNDRLILAPSSGWGDKTIQDVAPAEYNRDGTRTGGYFLKKQPLYISADLQQSRELVELMYKTGHSAPVRSRIGAETIQNGITFAMSGNSLLQILQMISQDKNPTYVHLGRVLGNAINVVASSGSLTGTLTVANNLSSQSQNLQLRIALSSASKTTASRITTVAVATDTAINNRDYKGDGASAPSPAVGNQVFLITDSGAASKFQVSDGNTAYIDATVAEALGANGRFLGVIDGAEEGSTAVTTNTAAKTYFDADPSRYDSSLTYYFFNGTDLRTVTYTAAVVADTASLTIVAEDADGDPITEVIEYKNAIDFSKVIATKNAFSEITSITPSGFTAGTVHITANPYIVRSETQFPAAITVANAANVATDGEIAYADDLRRTENVVRLTVTPNDAARVRSGSTSAKITFKGLSRGGEEITEPVRFTGNGQLSAKDTVVSYDELTEIKAEGFASGSTVTITFQDKATEVTFNPQDADTVVLVDAEMDKGKVPFTYRSLLANELTIGINRNDPLAAVMGVLGHSVGIAENIAGNPKGTTAKKSDLNGVEFDDPDIFIGYETEITVGGVRAPIVNASVSVNNNYTYSDAIGGKPEQEVLPYRDGKRQTMCEGEIIFSAQNNIAQDFSDNATYEDVVIKAENVDDGTFPFEFRVEFDEAQLATSGDPQSPESGMTTQPFNIRAYSTDSNEPTDYRFVCVVNDPIFLRRYDLAA